MKNSVGRIIRRNGLKTERLVGTPAEGLLRGKTGSLDGMIGLAGFVDSRATYAFAVIVTGLPPENIGAVDPRCGRTRH